MAAPGNRLQSLLQAAVQSVQWTYTIFWQLCPQQGVLIWSDGYYNGAIKTRKTVQPVEDILEDASLQRSQQLRELYDSLLAGETNHQTRRPCAALSPEDLTESEWFYLICASFSFSPGIGLPGEAYAKRKHIWLAGANEVASKIFSRAILAKSSRLQTVVCIPLLDGVVELGTTDRVEEDMGLVQHIRRVFTNEYQQPHPTKPALSEHSTSNPAASAEPQIQSHPLMLPTHTPSSLPGNTSQMEMEEGEAELDSNTKTDHIDSHSSAQNANAIPQSGGAEKIIRLDMSEDIRIVSPQDRSINMDLSFHLDAVAQPGNPVQIQCHGQLYKAESMHRWPPLPYPSRNSLPPHSVSPLFDELSPEDTHYSQTVSAILQHQSSRFSGSSSTIPSSTCTSTSSAFSKWSAIAAGTTTTPFSTQLASQWLLKYILFTVPLLHTKSTDATTSGFHKGKLQEELNANHVLAERRRHEKLNERFIILKSLVPFVTKMDKASILGDTIEYIRQLSNRVKELEERTRQMEAEQCSRTVMNSNQSTRKGPVPDKRKMKIIEGGGKLKALQLHATMQVASEDMVMQVEVSIIESDALIELQCPYREGLLFEIMQTLRKLRIETITVQSSASNGVFYAELRAKVKENVDGKRSSIVEVKRAINQIIPHY